jgi:hypothetical protein
VAREETSWTCCFESRFAGLSLIMSVLSLLPSDSGPDPPPPLTHPLFQDCLESFHPKRMV